MPNNDDPIIEQRVHSYAIDRGQCRKAANGMGHLPDLGVELEPEFEQRMRQLAADNDVDFDRFAAEYAASHQVIPANIYDKVPLDLVGKGVMPVNLLQDCFAGSLYSHILWESARREG